MLYNISMTKGDKKLFTDTDKLYMAMMMRRAGWSFENIAYFFGCDWTSVKKQARKYVILPQGNFNPQRIATQVTLQYQKPITYQEYLEVEKNKKKTYVEPLQSKGVIIEVFL